VRSIIASVLQVAGLAGLSFAGYLWTPVLGIAIGAGALLFLAGAIEGPRRRNRPPV
jgi:hypothetical protein